MRLGLTLGPWSSSTLADNLALALEAERLGLAVVLVPEIYGADAATVLAFLAARTTRIELGSAVLQIPGRTPANCAMTAASLDVLSGGRFRLGLGVSGPQVSEGWHGVRFDAPLGRTREYVEIVRRALAGDPVAHEGRHFTVPLPGGAGRPLRMTVQPVRVPVPIYLAAIGPRNLALAGEVADGWLASFFAPEHAAAVLDPLRAGRGVTGATLAGFDVVATTPLVVGENVQRCAAAVRPQAALYLGGMGDRDTNFYNQLAVRMGYEEEAHAVQDLFLTRRYAEAAAAVPLGFLETTSLLGDRERIADRLRALAGAGVTTVAVSLPDLPDRSDGSPSTLDERITALRTLVDAAEHAGISGTLPVPGGR